MIDQDRVRAAATDYVLQRYHLTDLAEAQRTLTPAQYEGVLREIEGVEAQIVAQVTAQAQPAPRDAGVNTPLGRVTPVTAVLLVAIWLVFAYESIQPGGSTNLNVLYNLGAVTSTSISSGQYWRLVATCFLHIGIFHIISNSVGLIWLGSLAERFYGPLRYLGIYLATGIGGSVAAVLTTTPNTISAGASGAIMGLVGALLAGSLRNRRVIGQAASRQVFSSLAFVLVLNVIIGFDNSGTISNAAHLGGAATGAVLALLIPYRSPRYGRPYAIAANVISALLIFLTLALSLTYVAAH